MSEQPRPYILGEDVTALAQSKRFDPAVHHYACDLCGEGIPRGKTHNVFTMYEESRSYWVCRVCWDAKEVQAKRRKEAEQAAWREERDRLLSEDSHA